MDTERAAFEPKGEVAEWQMLYEALLAQADFRAVITFEEISAVLGRDFSKNRGPIYRARAHLGAMRQRWLTAVPGVGYRVIEAREHIIVAEGHKQRGRRQLQKMVKVAEVTDLTRLTPDELVAFDSQSKVNMMVYMVLNHHERRIAPNRKHLAWGRSSVGPKGAPTWTHSR